MADILNSIDELKSQLDIVDVISRVVTLKKAGVNYKGICPFHNEKTPSFVVSEQKQIFTCFGCGATGDVIGFTKRYYNLEFQDAIEKLANENGISFSFNKSEVSKDRDRYFELNKDAARYFYSLFSNGKNKGYEYMKKRGIDDSTLRKFGIGYSDELWDSTLNYFKDKVKMEDLINLGFISTNGEKYYDKFRSRVIFPIFNAAGKITGFTGRTLNDDKPKYLNSPENIIFQKKNNLYGINLAKLDIGKEGYAILVEGNMDVISLYQAGIKNVVASCGTALTSNQAKLLKKYTKNIVLCYDSDKAGIEASFRGIEVLTSEGLNVKVMHVINGKDPDEYIKEFGKDSYLELIKNALPSTEYILNHEKVGLDLTKDEDKITFIKRATKILMNLSPTSKDIYLKKIAKELGISENAIRMELMSNDKESFDTTPINNIKEAPKNDNLSSFESTLLKILFIDSSYLEKIIPFEEIFNSFLGIRIRNIMYELYNKNGTFEQDEVLEKLDYEESNEVIKSIENIIVSGNEETVFNDLIYRWKLHSLHNKEKQLIDILSLSNEKENEDSINKINLELMEVQKEINELRKGK